MKRIVGLLLVLIASMAVMLGGSTSSGKAFTNGSISLSGMVYFVTITPTDNDNTDGNPVGQEEYFCVICYNANGTLFDIDIITQATGTTPVNRQGDCGGAVLDWGAPILPLSVQLTDPHGDRSGIGQSSAQGAAYCGVEFNIPLGDLDNDGVVNQDDQCANTPAGTPVNSAGCPDTDGDGVADTADNCPAVSNAGQANFDGDAQGDDCDPDDDNDTVLDGADACPTTPAGTPVGADGCPLVTPDDADGDGVVDGSDNCPNVFNPRQGDFDGDGSGNACDADDDNDGLIDVADECPKSPLGAEVDEVGCTPTPVDPNPGPEEPEPQPVVAGCDVTSGSPKGAVGGTFLITTFTYWMPDLVAQTNVVLEVGKTAKVLGVDESSEFFLIVWNCSYLWVPVGTIGPTYDNVWNGMPLPATVVG